MCVNQASVDPGLQIVCVSPSRVAASFDHVDLRLNRQTKISQLSLGQQVDIILALEDAEIEEAAAVLRSMVQPETIRGDEKLKVLQSSGSNVLGFQLDGKLYVVSTFRPLHVRMSA